MLHMVQAQYFSWFLSPIQIGIFTAPIFKNIIQKIYIQYLFSTSLKGEPSNDMS